MLGANKITVFSPVKGEVISIDRVPEEAFAQKMLGDGVGIKPADNAIYAPFDGRIKTLNKALHALVIETYGVEVLIHIGIDTVNLKGEGFTAFTRSGASVKKGEKLIEFDRDFIAKKAPSNIVIIVVANPPDAILDIPENEPVSHGDILFTVERPTQALESTFTQMQSEPEYISEEIEVLNSNGLHARPASIIANIAAKYDFKIRLVKNGIGVNAKNLVEIMGLNVMKHDRLQVAAYGRATEEAVQEIIKALKNGLGEDISAEPDPALDNTMTLDMRLEQIVPASVINKGKALGQSFIYSSAVNTFDENGRGATEEKNRLRRAIAALKTEINRNILMAKTRDEKDILSAHLTILNDNFILDSAIELINKGKSAPYAITKATEQSVAILNKTNNALIMERAADFNDVKNRLIIKMIGNKEKLVFPKNTILIAKDLLPSDTEHLNSDIKGVILAEGSETAHVSIILKNMGVPAVYGAGLGMLNIPNGSPVIIDTSHKKVWINPSSGLMDTYKKRIEEEKLLKQKYLAAAHQPAITQDGADVFVRGNVSDFEQAQHALNSGADGIGLVRTEFMFQNRITPPSEEEQLELYQKILSAAGKDGAVIRTFDFGGDKPIGYLRTEREENPVLGMRGMRVYKSNEDLIRAQLRALLQTSPLAALKILVPMVTFAEDLVYIRQLLKEEQTNLNINTKANLGIMLETPAAVLNMRAFQAHSDFFSLGTNDLTQYTLAIDRGNKNLTRLADALHPAVIKLMHTAAQDARKFGKPLSICGAVASNPSALPVLIGLGITDLAVTSGQVPEVKYIARQLNAGKCQKIIPSVLEMESAEQVKEYISENFGL